MIKLRKLGIADTALFKSQVFTFEEGISYIYGLNHSGRTKDSNGNAAGKSQFFSRIGELIYDEPIVGTKQDKMKKGKSFIEYEYNGHTIKVMSSFKGRSENFTIWIDGKQSKYNTPAKAKPALRKLFPPTKDDFDSYIYLDSRVPHPLVRGSSMERKRFFTSFFGLDKIDAERKLFAAELSKITKVKAAYQELDRSYQSMKKDLLSPEQRAELKERHTKLSKEHAELSAKADKAQRIKQVLEFVDAAQDHITELREACGDEITQESFDEALKTAKWNLRTDSEDLEDAIAWERYQEDLAEYKAAISKLGENIKDAKYYKEKALAYEKTLPLYRSAKQQLEDLPGLATLTKCPKPEEDLDELRTKKSQLTVQLEHAHKFEDGECYACGQSVKVKDPKKLQAEISRISRLLDGHRAYEGYLAAKKENAVLQAKQDELAAKVKEYRTILKDTKEAFDIYKVLRYLKRPAPFEGKKLEVSIKKKMLEDSKHRLSLFTYCRPHLDSIIEALSLSKEDMKLKDFDASKLTVIQDELSTIRASMAVHKNVRSRVVETQARLEEMAVTLKEEEPLRLLIKGYSDKAIKRMAIEAVSNRLMQLINHHAQQVFSGYTFEFRWETQISILVHRPNGETSDIRKLSGAEAMLFTLILVPALLAFTPEKKRVSAIIMDEPSASLSEATIQAFHDLLPQLNKLIPSIIVITPKAEERLATAKNYTVFRDKNGAKILNGHPSEYV